MAERIKTLLRSDMPPVQFKLLGTLRMLVDGQGESDGASYSQKVTNSPCGLLDYFCLDVDLKLINAANEKCPACTWFPFVSLA